MRCFVKDDVLLFLGLGLVVLTVRVYPVLLVLGPVVRDPGEPGGGADHDVSVLVELGVDELDILLPDPAGVRFTDGNIT